MVEPHTEVGSFAPWARVRQLAAGTPIAQRGDASAHWIGVTSGAVRLGSGLRDGRNFTLATSNSSTTGRSTSTRSRT